MAEMHPLEPARAGEGLAKPIGAANQGIGFQRRRKGRAGLATFKAIRIDKAEKGTTAALTQFDEAELMDGDVTVAVEWSTVNYKDGLAITGKSPVVRRFPMFAGIDFAGTVLESSQSAW
jgi:acrylyl-CoA reductase (NADPH)